MNLKFPPPSLVEFLLYENYVSSIAMNYFIVMIIFSRCTRCLHPTLLHPEVIVILLLSLRSGICFSGNGCGKRCREAE